MKLKFPLIAVFAAMASLAACGGGGSSSSSVAVDNPAAFSKTDTVVGTGADAVNGKVATVNYSGWLYSATAANNKGSSFETGTFAFTIGAGKAIAGFDQGVPGMKVGGKRTLIIPASMAYGSAGAPPKIPANSGLVFDVELTNIQ
jgi:FKBP-type peptidyl-prolyl cis-trans isomerase FkpA